MGWEEQLIDLNENIWNHLHTQKYLNEKFGEGSWEKVPRKSIDTYVWENNNLKVLIQKPTIKEGIVKIIKEGQDPIVKYIWNMKEIKELI
tara:strand:+ start:381 stop:650 length:270 start_codon:yes stop_codon:yes gene_type:complete